MRCPGPGGQLFFPQELANRRYGGRGKGGSGREVDAMCCRQRGTQLTVKLEPGTAAPRLKPRGVGSQDLSQNGSLSLSVSLSLSLSLSLSPPLGPPWEDRPQGPEGRRNESVGSVFAPSPCWARVSPAC